MVHRCRVSRTCICGRFSRSRARCTLTRALARAASAGKSGTPGEIRSGRAANRARSDSSLRASSSLLSARMRDISPTLPPAGVSRPAAGCDAVDYQDEHQQESSRKPVESRGGDPLRRGLAAEGHGHHRSDGHEGKDCEDRCGDRQRTPETRGYHAVTLTVRRCGRAAKQDNGANQDNLD